MDTRREREAGGGRSSRAYTGGSNPAARPGAGGAGDLGARCATDPTTSNVNAAICRLCVSAPKFGGTTAFGHDNAATA